LGHIQVSLASHKLEAFWVFSDAYRCCETGPVGLDGGLFY